MGCGQGRKGRRRYGLAHNHVAVDASGLILVADLTEAETPEAEIAPGLLSSTGGNIERVTTAGGYDRESVYEAVAKLGAAAVIPPRRTRIRRINR
jgi:hypothetical protein